MIRDEIKRRLPGFTKSELRVANYVLDNANDVIELSISEIAEKTETSDATIIRFCKRLGLNGVYQLKINLSNELGNAGYIVGDKPGQASLYSDYWERVGSYAAHLSKVIDEETVDSCLEEIYAASTIHIAGWGNTGMVAADFAHRLTMFGFNTFFSTIPEYAIRNLATSPERTLVVAFSHSGSSIHIIDTLKLAKSLDRRTILITNTEESPAKKYADIKLISNLRNEIFQDLGAASHILEYMIIDLLLFGIVSKGEPKIKISDQAEVLLSRHKL